MKRSKDVAMNAVESECRQADTLVRTPIRVSLQVLVILLLIGRAVGCWKARRGCVGAVVMCGRRMRLLVDVLDGAWKSVYRPNAGNAKS